MDDDSKKLLKNVSRETWKGIKMAVRTSEELIKIVSDRIGDDNSDAALAILEDIADTLNSLESKKNEDWETKYNELDAEWRKKYRDRFEQNIETNDREENKAEIKTVEDLFI